MGTGSQLMDICRLRPAQVRFADGESKRGCSNRTTGGNGFGEGIRKWDKGQTRREVRSRDKAYQDKGGTQMITGPSLHWTSR